MPRIACVAHFVLAVTVCASAAAGTISVRHDEPAGRVEVLRDGKVLLRYNFKTVPVPAALKGRKYAEPRSNYLHPLCSPDGECLTRDFPSDHPHHRGVYWAWPEVYYKGKVRDLHALQGVFARPKKPIAASAEYGVGTIEAVNVWKWDDAKPIVRERARIEVRPAEGDGYFVDFTFRFEAIVEGVLIARRGQRAYGGLNLRTVLVDDQRITEHTDPAGTAPRRSYAQITGVVKGAQRPAAIAIFQHAGNPRYPGDWVKYPKIAWLQPTFPASGEKYPLSKSKPLVLRYRLWVQAGTGASDKELIRAWDAYNSTADGKVPDKKKEKQ